MTKEDLGLDENLATAMLTDGASGEFRPTEFLDSDEYRLARDPNESISSRLEVYEDLIDSQVGDTNLVRARNLERDVGVRQVFLKFEGGNPTGTQKDRIAFAQVMDALRRGYDAVTVATCGNYGAAIAIAAPLAGLKAIVHIPDRYHSRRVDEIRQAGSEIVRVSGDYERAVEASQELAEKQDVYDANPGGPNTSTQLKTYGEIAYEIYDELGDAPRAIAVPVSNGTTLAGIYRGFLSLYRRGKTSKMPQIVAGSSFRKNPIVVSILEGREDCRDLDPAKIRETTINEPLINWHSIDGELAVQAIRATDGWADHATDRAMLNYSRLVREREGMHVLPASTAGLIALVNRQKVQPLAADRYVAVLTGRRE